MNICDMQEFNAACKAKGYDPINLSGLAYVLRVCEVRKFKYANSGMWHYELRYRGHKAYEHPEAKTIKMRVKTWDSVSG